MKMKSGEIGLTIAWNPEVWAQIEEFRATQRPIPSQSEAIRHLTKRALLDFKKERETKERQPADA